MGVEGSAQGKRSRRDKVAGADSDAATEPSIVAWGRSRIVESRGPAYAVKIMRLYRRSGVIVLDNGRDRQDLLAQSVAYGIDRGWLRFTETVTGAHIDQDKLDRQGRARGWESSVHRFSLTACGARELGV